MDLVLIKLMRHRMHACLDVPIDANFDENSKLLESHVGKCILNRCMPLFDPKQFGALKGRSTTHELVELLHTWNEALDQRKCVRVLFVDFQKTFDHVDHTTVIRKFLQFGIPSSVTNCMVGFVSQ